MIVKNLYRKRWCMVSKTTNNILEKLMANSYFIDDSIALGH